MAYVPPVKNLEKKKVGVIPQQVKKEHLNPDGSLLTKEEIAAIPMDKGDTRLSKSKQTNNGLPYSIITKDNKAYAVYGNKVLLGKGGFGKVKLAQDVQTNEWVALKVVDVKAKNINELRANFGYLETEVALLHRITGRGVMVADPNPAVVKFHLIMQLEVGDTADTLRQRHDLINLNGRLIIAQNMVKALNTLHEKKFIHRDIKGANIIVNPFTNEVGIVDFGMVETTENAKNDKNKMGTPGYMAPEVAYGRSSYSEKSDMYAMGVTIAKWFNLEVKLRKDSGIYVVKEINETSKFQEMVPDSKMRKEMLDLVRGMCEPNITNRLDGKEAEARLQKITERLSFTQLKSNTVGVLNVDEYMKLNNGEQLFMRQALMRFDRVVLVYSKENRAITDADVALTHKELTAAGIKCMREAYTYLESNKERVMTDLDASFRSDYSSPMQLMHVTENNSFYSGNFLGANDSKLVMVSPDKTSDDYKSAMLTSIIGQLSINRIKEDLQKELMRVQAKYGKEPSFINRQKEITKFIAMLDQQAGKITYQDLSKHLSTLAQQLHKVSQPNRSFMFFKSNTHTEKVVANIHTAITPKNRN